MSYRCITKYAMFRVAASISFIWFFTFAYGNPVARNMVVHEMRDEIPEGFVNHGPAPADTTLNLRIALVQRDIEGLQKALMDVSTPLSPLYGQHLTKEEVEEFVKPIPETTKLVNGWLASNGIQSSTISPAGDWLAFSLPVSQANTLLHAQFSIFTHQDTSQQFVLTLSYSIPAALQGHIDLIHPTITFPNPFANLPAVFSPIKVAATSSSTVVPTSCGETITPACLQALYAIPLNHSTQPTNSLAVSGFIDQFANAADLKTFLEKLRPDLSSSTTFTLQTLDGGSNPQTPSEAGVEANLDIQYAIGIATGVSTVFISVGDNFQDGALDGFLDIINFLLGETAPPHVLTTSYGQNENTISRALATQLCNAFAQLGARGTSILFSSGDGGVAGSQSTQCSTSFLPTFPSGCPFMTSVGATTGITETAASFSSGGFSNYFATPSYQASSVAAYLEALGSTNAGKFNVSGRGFPDVSAQGENVEIVVDTEFGTVSGTSCSSPIFAAIIALLNDQFMTFGLPPLGFLNPFLYSDAGIAALNDITTGNNPGCGTNGFPAKVGWDPVTGLGTPAYWRLLQAVAGPTAEPF